MFTYFSHVLRVHIGGTFELFPCYFLDKNFHFDYVIFELD